VSVTAKIKHLQRVQNNAARIVLQVPRRFHTKPLLHQLHWLPVQQRITQELAVLTYKVRSTSTPVYLHRRITERDCSRTLRSNTILLLVKPFMRTDFSKRAFQFSAPTVWNSLPQTVLISDSLTVFKSRLKTVLFCFFSVFCYSSSKNPAESSAHNASVPDELWVQRDQPALEDIK